MLRPGRLGQVVDHAVRVVDGLRHGVEQRGAAAHLVILAREVLDLAQVDVVVEIGDVVVEEDGGHVCPALHLAVLLQHRVDAADRVALQSHHRTATVQDENELGLILLHDCLLRLLASRPLAYDLDSRRVGERVGQLRGDIA